MNRNRRQLSLGVTSLLLLILGVTPARAGGRVEHSLPVRVEVVSPSEEITFSLRSRYRIIDPVTWRELDSGRRLKSTKARVCGGAICLGGQPTGMPRVRIVPDKDVTLELKGVERRYRGAVDFLIQDEDKLLAVNRIELEDYVCGVLYHEVSHRWPMEALKAQAVATRSYALYQMKMNRQKDYDVHDDIYSQVYGGRTSERYRTNLAVRKTRGEILVFHGDVLPAYFSATCAGRTEDVREVWKHERMQPLSGVKCGFCRLSPHYHWKKNFRLKDIQDRLNENGYDLGLIKEIRIQERNASGRIRNLLIVTRDGKTVTISGKDFRQIIGPNEIRSNNYRIEMKGYYMDLIGKGWGHGVGLCQWGAYGMAKQRYRYKDILDHYYPGALVMDFWETPLAARWNAGSPDTQK